MIASSLGRLGKGHLPEHGTVHGANGRSHGVGPRWCWPWRDRTGRGTAEANLPPGSG